MTVINKYHKYKININIINIKQYYSLKNIQKPKCKMLPKVLFILSWLDYTLVNQFNYERIKERQKCFFFMRYVDV